MAAQSITSCASRLGIATIRTAVSEADALAQLGDNPAELILADTAVSRPDTVGFTQRVLALSPQAVLLLFGAEDPKVAAAAVAAGARGLIRGGSHDLVATVTKAILLIGSPRRAAGARPEPAAREPANGSALRQPGSGAGVERSGPVGGGGGRSSERPNPALPGPGPVGAGSLVLPAQRGDAPGAEGPQTHPPLSPEQVRRPTLTERELQVLRGMAEGKSNAEIGRDLFVSEDTVKTHARRLFRKLRARDRAHAVAVGFRVGALS